MLSSIVGETASHTWYSNHSPWLTIFWWRAKLLMYTNVMFHLNSAICDLLNLWFVDIPYSVYSNTVQLLFKLSTNYNSEAIGGNFGCSQLLDCTHGTCGRNKSFSIRKKLLCFVHQIFLCPHVNCNNPMKSMCTDSFRYKWKLSRAYHKITLFSVSKDEWDTKEGP